MDTYRSAGVAVIAALIGPDGSGEAGAGDASRIARRCERAVVIAYRELRTVGESDAAASLACVRLYRMHHPEASPVDSQRLVAAWIDYHGLRGMADV